MTSLNTLDNLKNWAASQNTALPSPLTNGLELVAKLYEDKSIDTLVPILPLLLSLKGEPFHINDHMPMEPLYRFRNIPMQLILKCGRQVTKSTSLGATGVILSAITGYLNTLYVNPLFEQTRRFSNNVIRPFIDESPIRQLIRGEGDIDNSVLQRTFSNGSNMFFTFAFLDAERARGIPADIIRFDELQDIDPDFIPVILACADASKYGIVQMSGTPKTIDNPIEYNWGKSSQAHWITKCECGYYNIAGLEFGLMDMIQEHGFACCKCMRKLNARQGFHYHMFKERKDMFPGYHVPQCIMPMHFENERKWYTLYNRKLTWPQAKFLNEVCGESCDTGQRLVTLTQLRACATLDWDLDYEQGRAARFREGYTSVTLGVDWGGGGGGIVRKRRGQVVIEAGTPSFTVACVTGFRHNSMVPEVIYAVRLPITMTPSEEAQFICKLFADFKCDILAHDYGGAGSIREAMILQANMSEDVLMPCIYTRSPSRPIITYEPPSIDRPRKYYSVDKARSLLLLCSIINSGMMRFTRWPSAAQDSATIYEDFISLIETRMESPRGSDVYLVTKNPKSPDDFCHALNLACLAHWHSTQEYPDLAHRYGITYGVEFNELTD